MSREYYWDVRKVKDTKWNWVMQYIFGMFVKALGSGSGCRGDSFMRAPVGFSLFVGAVLVPLVL